MFTIRVEHHFYPQDGGGVLSAIDRLRELIMENQTELANQLRGLKDQADKARAEIVAKIAALEAAMANGGPVTAEVQAAFDDLKASVQTVDDIVPDAPPAAG